MSFFASIIANGASLFLLDSIFDTFTITGGAKSLLIASLLLTAMNAVIKPILKFISTPLILITFGLFIVVINAALLWFTDYLLKSITIENVTTLVWATLLIGFINIIIKPRKKEPQR